MSKIFPTSDLVFFVSFFLFVSFFFLKKKKYLFSVLYSFVCFSVFYYSYKITNLFSVNLFYIFVYILFLHFVYILRSIIIDFDIKVGQKSFYLLLFLNFIYGIIMIIVYSDSIFFKSLFISSLVSFLLYFLYYFYEKKVYTYLKTIMPSDFLISYSYLLYSIFFIIISLFIFASISNIYSVVVESNRVLSSYLQEISSIGINFITLVFIIWVTTCPFVLYFLNRFALKVVHSLKLTNVDRFHTLYELFKSILKGVYIIFSLLFFCGPENLKIIIPSISFSFIAFKDLVFGFINAVLILTEDSINIGEFVEIAGVSGKIEEISLRYIKLRDFEGSLFIVPFYKVETIRNRGKDFVYVILRVNVSIETNSDRVIALMKEAFNLLKKRSEYEYLRSNFLDNIEVVGLTSFNNVCMVFEARIKIRPFNTRFIKANYYKIIKELFDNEGIEFGYEYVCIASDRNIIKRK